MCALLCHRRHTHSPASLYHSLTRIETHSICSSHSLTQNALKIYYLSLCPSHSLISETNLLNQSRIHIEDSLSLSLSKLTHSYRRLAPFSLHSFLSLFEDSLFLSLSPHTCCFSQGTIMGLLSYLALHLLVLALIQVTQRTAASTCDTHILTVYKVLVKTYWSREDFPKQYPEWRPPAQWSKVLGRSHDPSFHLFHVGETASEGLKQFAELSHTDRLDTQSQGVGGVFDEFIAPPITQGVGETRTQFFVDGNHSKVSMMSRVVPSPDWFIGVDSLELCVEGKWLESVVLEVDPMDAGTDNGFTFTSPNWPTVPKKPIIRITAQNPNHPANSFYYPDRDQHPPIATFHIVKIKEYQLRQIFSGSFSQAPSKRYKTNTRSENGDSNLYQDLEVSNNVIVSSSVTTSAPWTTGDNSIINDVVNKFKKFRKNRRGRKMARRRSRAPRDCRVSKWSDWSLCSKTCGIGEQIRTRTVVRHSRRGGRPCPLLQENQWCGSSKDCDHKYFDW